MKLFFRLQIVPSSEPFSSIMTSIFSISSSLPLGFFDALTGLILVITCQRLLAEASTIRYTQKRFGPSKRVFGILRSLSYSTLLLLVFLIFPLYNSVSIWQQEHSTRLNLQKCKQHRVASLFWLQPSFNKKRRSHQGCK